MNQRHLQFLASSEWQRMLETDLLPWVLEQGDLGPDVLEIGPGPGLTTDLLRRRATMVTAIELDADLAAALAARLAQTNVAVIHADATQSNLAGNSFSTVTCFSMLHHVPSADLQDRVFAEIERLLRPGGRFLGVDSRDTEAIRQGHSDDVFVPMDPATLPPRLERVGMTDIAIDTDDYQIRFSARKPEQAR